MVTPSTELLAALTRFSADAVVLVDATGVIQWASPSTPDVLGYAPEDLAGIHVRDIIEPDDRDTWQDRKSTRLNSSHT